MRAIGDKVYIWKPGHAEHGLTGIISEVVQYDGPVRRGPNAYKSISGWTDNDGYAWCGGSFPDAMLCSEEEWMKKDPYYTQYLSLHVPLSPISEEK
ncbi:MAG: hypothetical protein GY749_27425 [Desulfobacteraceae bacterium]|nr:hypothetical protein [Desulfobacteraceae bacterium]